jgi:hypothetical protein
MKTLLLAGLLAVAPLAVSAQTAEGFAELRFHGHLGAEGRQWELVQRVRPEFEAELGERLVLSATVELGLHQGRTIQDEIQRTVEDSALGPVMDSMGCTWPSEENEVLGISRTADYLSVERLYLDAYLPWADVRIGRQAVQWGSALMVNPTDPFPEVIMTEPWRPRSGVNALRVTIPVGESHQLKAVVGSNDTFDKLRLAGRGTWRLGLWDLSVVGAWRQESEDGIAGLDLRGTWGVGWWLETALHVEGAGEGDVYEELAAGVDYSFPVMEMLVVSAQYYRNGGGSADAAPGVSAGRVGEVAEAPDCGAASPALFAASTSQSSPFAPFFRGVDYGMLTFNLQITPDIGATGLWVQNLRDGTGMAVPMISYFPTGWLELVLAAQAPFSLWGDGGELHPAEEDLKIEAQPGVELDLSGMVPAATILLWSRFSF